jgi:hypothetical protein
VRVQVVPVERTMNKDALRYPLLLDIVLCLVTLMLGSFGILVRTRPPRTLHRFDFRPRFVLTPRIAHTHTAQQGYLTYGNDTKDVITLNLPGANALIIIIIIIFRYNEIIILL